MGILNLNRPLVDLRPPRASWAEADLAMALADAHGVVCLMELPDWVHRPVRPLPRATPDRPALERTHDGVDLVRAEPPLTTGALSAPRLAEGAPYPALDRLGESGWPPLRRRSGRRGRRRWRWS